MIGLRPSMSMTATHSIFNIHINRPTTAYQINDGHSSCQTQCNRQYATLRATLTVTLTTSQRGTSTMYYTTELPLVKEFKVTEKSGNFEGQRNFLKHSGKSTFDQRKFEIMDEPFTHGYCKYDKKYHRWDTFFKNFCFYMHVFCLLLKLVFFSWLMFRSSGFIHLIMILCVSEL